jgi:hypothetical protein
MAAGGGSGLKPRFVTAFGCDSTRCFLAEGITAGRDGDLYVSVSDWVDTCEIIEGHRLHVPVVRWAEALLRSDFWDTAKRQMVAASMREVSRTRRMGQRSTLLFHEVDPCHMRNP